MSNYLNGAWFGPELEDVWPYDTDERPVHEVHNSEFKTGKKWTQDKANKHRQIDMYASMIYLKYGIKPEELKISLILLPTEEQQDFLTDFVNKRNEVRNQALVEIEYNYDDQI